MKKRVVITGLGAVTPLGNTVEEFWNNVKEGKCGIDFIQSFDTGDFKVKIAAEVKDFNAKDYIDKKEAKRMDRFSHFALAAAKMAFEDSNLNKDDFVAERFGAIVGSGIGGLSTIENESRKLFEKGPNRVSPFFIPMSISNMAAGNIGIMLGAKGINTCVVTACASATNSIGEAYKVIKHGGADIMITGGAEASITPLAIAGFTNMTALNTSNDPKRASIPFDLERSGFVMGEGAGMMILEELEHAQKRGAKIYGEVVGYGSTADAYHITSPAPGGEGGARAMSLAIQDAGINSEEISYINAHGTSTPLNDKFETAAIKTVFGENAKNIPISSTKSMVGHLLGAAGAVEAIICTKALQEGNIPATINYENPDPECDLDYVPNESRKADLKYALSNSLGFGGQNATIILKKWEEN